MEKNSSVKKPVQTDWSVAEATTIIDLLNRMRRTKTLGGSFTKEEVFAKLKTIKIRWVSRRTVKALVIIRNYHDGLEIDQILWRAIKESNDFNAWLFAYIYLDNIDSEDHHQQIVEKLFELAKSFDDYSRICDMNALRDAEVAERAIDKMIELVPEDDRNKLFDTYFALYSLDQNRPELKKLVSLIAVQMDKLIVRKQQELEAEMRLKAIEASPDGSPLLIAMDKQYKRFVRDLVIP